LTIEIDEQKYYRTSEACKKTVIRRATLLRWLKAGILEKKRIRREQFPGSYEIEIITKGATYTPEIFANDIEHWEKAADMVVIRDIGAHKLAEET
jgi:hypothetical protein